MRREFADAEVGGWEPLARTYGLPDPDDEHVVAAAVIAGAGAIVTENFKDFPSDRIPPTIQVLSAREFARNTVTLNPHQALAAVQEIARRSGRLGEALTVEEFLDVLRDRYGMIEADEMMVEASSEQSPSGRPEHGWALRIFAFQPPRFCHESDRDDLIETAHRHVRIHRIMRFRFASVAVCAISNPSVSAEKPRLSRAFLVLAAQASRLAPTPVRVRSLMCLNRASRSWNSITRGVCRRVMVRS